MIDNTVRNNIIYKGNKMSFLLGLIGAVIWLIGGLGVIIFGFLAFINRKRNNGSMYVGAGTISFIILVIGIALMTFSEKNYWERTAMSESEEKENEEIVKNIQRNEQLEEEAYQNSLQEQQKELDSEQVVETAQQSSSEIEFLDEQGVYNTVVNYGNGLIEAINNGDFLIVESYLLPGSELYISQRKLVDDLSSQGIVENFNTFNIESIRKVDGTVFEVETFEEVSIERAGTQEIKVFQWIYTVQNVNGNYLLSDIRSK
jgi:hypothetical protein